MIQRRFRYISLIGSALAISLLIQPAFAQERRAKARKSTHEKGSPLTSVTFDPAAEALPPNFKGNNIKTIYHSISVKNIFLDKSEYETKAQYEARKKEALLKPYIGSLRLDSLLAFSVSDLKTEYDAELQMLKAKVGLLSGQLTLLTDLVKKISYIGRNAFGVRARVTEKLYFSYDLLCDNYRDLNVSTWSDLVFLLPMSAEIALVNRYNLRVLIICKPDEPFVQQTISSDKPTLNDPLGIHIKKHILRVKVFGVWIYDSRTGRVLAKARAITETRTIVDQIVAERNGPGRSGTPVNQAVPGKTSAVRQLRPEAEDGATKSSGIVGSYSPKDSDPDNLPGESGDALTRTAKPIRGNTDPQIEQIVKEAERHYQDGQQAYSKGEYDRARREFDQAVDTVLIASIDLRRNDNLRAYYRKLIEDINRYQIASLEQKDGGFSEQYHEPSPLDKIASLDPWELEGEIETAELPIIGDPKNRKYHHPNCPNYRSVASNTFEIFRVWKAAERAGYTLADNCPKR